MDYTSDASAQKAKAKGSSRRVKQSDSQWDPVDPNHLGQPEAMTWQQQEDASKLRRSARQTKPVHQRPAQSSPKATQAQTSFTPDEIWDAVPNRRELIGNELTWQQQLLKSQPPASPSAKPKGRKTQAASSITTSLSNLSLTSPADYTHQNGGMHTPSPAKSKLTKAKSKEASLSSSPSLHYAGPQFHNSPSAQDLPAPRTRVRPAVG
ncbi:uncharacterized protein L969DRAFT_16641 [Mixia osmundae IAM 14324]|uniref:Uncharacterized protein n=1 Tax=Mixia osmundae (strain CBS 9802 / IAM 14324 / JCM 22182 / KY 12970) TaxID=764103 RepID=G7E9L7_MIXOS|nr:uncharacterized protein L969DRAFT_16641 [Mixia osmundae IAM 14324]KEI39966.1 hypothetical protein L969DRAFT_16641 [Mixia osmundae IAM 14324]GAA99336.1 hypothetical protein E5Q_06031 [Mixia osmundae IAM 14324]